MFLRGEVLVDRCGLKYVAGAQRRCPIDHIGAKTFEMREHLSLILLLVSETLS